VKGSSRSSGWDVPVKSSVLMWVDILNMLSFLDDGFHH